MKKKTFKELVAIWEKRKSQTIKKTSFISYRNTIHTYLIPLFAEREQIEEEEVQDLIFELRAKGTSHHYTRDIVMLLKNILSFGARMRVWEAIDWQLEFPRNEERKRIQVMSTKHHKILLKHLADNASPQNVAALIALSTGMRIGEILALTWDDIDLKGCVIYVDKTVSILYDALERKTEKHLSTAKTQSSAREVPISKILYKALASLRKEAANDYVVGDNPTPQDQRTCRDRFYRLCNRLNIPKIKFHGLRHTFASRCIESGADPKTVSRILGHANVAITLNLYVHPGEEQMKRCIDKMNRFVGLDD